MHFLRTITIILTLLSLNCGCKKELVKIKITTKLKSPCFKQFEDEAFITKLESEIFKLYQQVPIDFGKSLNIKIEQKPELFDEYGQVILYSSQADTTLQNTWIIYLNEDCADLGTKELWTYFILQESLYGIIKQQKISFQIETDGIKEHGKIFSRWFIQLENSLMNLYKIPEEDAKIFACYAIYSILRDEVNTHFHSKISYFICKNALVGIGEHTEAIRHQYQTGQRGTSCK